MALKNFATGRSDTFTIPLKKLRPKPGHNTRIDFGDLDELARDIASNGQRETITVCESDCGNWVDITNGERRWRAIRIANEKYGGGFTAMRCIAETKSANEIDITVDLVVRNSSKPLTALEEAEVYNRLVNFNLSVSEIAKRTGRKDQRIRDLLALRCAPEDVREGVDKGTISPTAGKRLAKAAPETRKLVMDKAKAGDGKIKVSDVDVATGGAPKVSSTYNMRQLSERVDILVDATKNPSTPKMSDEKKAYFIGVQSACDAALGKLAIDEVIKRAANFQKGD